MYLPVTSTKIEIGIFDVKFEAKVLSEVRSLEF
jgi:hypothetical protein